MQFAQTAAKQAADEASDLEQSAAGHGWMGVAQTMASAQESLQEVTSAIASAIEATSEGLGKLAEITEEMSSDEVAGRLAGINSQFESARSAAGQAADSMDEARTAAEQADAESLLQLVDGAHESLSLGVETLAIAVDLTGSEQTEATAWGN